jgi:hypothetical protein
VGRALLAGAFALAIGACEAFGVERSGTFTIVVPAQELVDQLVVDVIDRTATVEAIGIAHGQFLEGIVRDPADPAVIVVTWMGGMCDSHTTLTVEPTLDTIRISEATEVRPGACRLAGIMHSIAIRFDPPLLPEFIEFGKAVDGA